MVSMYLRGAPGACRHTDERYMQGDRDIVRNLDYVRSSPSTVLTRRFDEGLERLYIPLLQATHRMYHRLLVNDT